MIAAMTAVMLFRLDVDTTRHAHSAYSARRKSPRLNSSRVSAAHPCCLLTVGAVAE
jgi:hypothetical protein